MRDPVVHDLKIHPLPFADARSGRKPPSEAELSELLGRMRTLVADHAPDGWPAVRMRDLTALCDAIISLGTAARHQAGLPDFTPRLLELQAELNQRRADAARWGDFITRLADALGVPEVVEFGTATGYAEDHLLAAAARFRTLAGPDADARLQEALGLIQDAASTWLLGSGAGAKDKAAQAAVVLTQLLEGRA